MKPGKGRLTGVRVEVYQGADANWHASLLLDPAVWTPGHRPGYDRGPAAGLPPRGNRPRCDVGSGWWWYDVSASRRAYRRHHPASGGAAPRTDAETLKALQAEVAGILRDLLSLDVSDVKIIACVEAIPVRRNSRARAS